MRCCSDVALPGWLSWCPGVWQNSEAGGNAKVVSKLSDKPIIHTNNSKHYKLNNINVHECLTATNDITKTQLGGGGRLRGAALRGGGGALRRARGPPLLREGGAGGPAMCIRGSHLSNATCLIQVFFNSGE